MPDKKLMRELDNIKKSFIRIRKDFRKYKGWNMYNQDFVESINDIIRITGETLSLIKNHSLLKELPMMKDRLNKLIEVTSTKAPRVRNAFNSNKVNKLYDNLFNYGFNNSWINAVLRHQIAVFGNFLNLTGKKK